MSSNSLAGKVALVTGGSKGIGKATVLRLAQDGAKVVVNFSSDSSAADELVQQLGKDRAFAIKADVGKVDEIERLVKETVDHFGKIDILVANAGVMDMKDLENTTEKDFDVSMAVNVKGPFFLAQKAVPHMPPGSHLILLSTSLCAASTVTPVYLLYLATKGAIEQMTRVLSKDLARKQISVNCVAPGPTGTELFYKGKSEQLIKGISNQSPFGRLGEPNEIAEVIVFLSGSASQWVAGQIVRVNGGMA